MRKLPEFQTKPIKGVNQEDWGKLTVGYYNTADAKYAKTDYLFFKPELINELAKPFTNAQQMKEFEGENQEQIRQAGAYIMGRKVERPEWFDDIIKGNQESLEECVKIALQYNHINEVPQRIKNRMWLFTTKEKVRELLSDLKWSRQPRTDNEILDIMNGFKTAADMRNTSNEFKNLLSKVTSNPNVYPKSHIRLQEMKTGHTTRSKRGKYAQRTPAIEQYDLNNNHIQTFQTWDDAVNAGFNRNSIAGAIRGTDGNNKYKKFLWKHEGTNFTK